MAPLLGERLHWPLLWQHEESCEEDDVDTAMTVGFDDEAAAAVIAANF